MGEIAVYAWIAGERFGEESHNMIPDSVSVDHFFPNCRDDTAEFSDHVDGSGHLTKRDEDIFEVDPMCSRRHLDFTWLEILSQLIINEAKTVEETRNLDFQLERSTWIMVTDLIEFVLPISAAANTSEELVIHLQARDHDMAIAVDILIFSRKVVSRVAHNLNELLANFRSADCGDAIVHFEQGQRCSAFVLAANDSRSSSYHRLHRGCGWRSRILNRDPNDIGVCGEHLLEAGEDFGILVQQQGVFSSVQDDVGLVLVNYDILESIGGLFPMLAILRSDVR